MSIDLLIERMQAMMAEIPPEDPLRLFHGTYTRTTLAVRDEIQRVAFLDNPWVERWDVAFADLYLDALSLWRSGGAPASPWQTALDATRGPHLPPLRYVLLGMNAHINFDLPQSLLGVISPTDFADPAVVALRAADHTHVDSILASRVSAEDDELNKAALPGDRTLLDRMLTPFNRLATKRFLAEARAKVWTNVRILNDARQAGREDLAQRIRELEVLSEARVAQLVRPGQVVLELARNGFGVVLTQQPAA
jgi:hypothetical protein